MKRMITATAAMLLAMWTSAPAQIWTPTAGPEGASVYGLAAVTNGVAALVQPGAVLVYTPGTGWVRRSGVAAGALFSMGDTLFVTTSSALLRSVDAGVSWSAVGPSGASPRMSVQAGTIYLALDSTIYRSDDRGGRWAMIAKAPMDFFTLNAHNALILLGRGGDSAGLYRSADAGDSWALVSYGLPAGQPPQVLYRAGATLYAAFDGHGVFRSTDAGRSWTAMNEGLDRVGGSYPPITAMLSVRGNLWLASLGGHYVYDGERWSRQGVRAATSLAAGGGRIFVGSKEGVEFSRDTAWEWRSLNVGLMAQRADVMTRFRGAAHVTMGGAIHRSADHGEHWNRTALIDVARFAATEDRAYALGNRLGRFGLFTTTDGLDWGMMDTLGLPYPMRWAGAIAVSGDTVYIGFNHVTWGTGGMLWEYGGVFRTTDGGASWQGMNGTLPHDGSGYVPVMDVLTIGGVVLACTGDGMYRSTDGGGYWQYISPNLPANSGPARMVATGGDVFLAFPGMAFVSSDSGSTWREISDGIATRANIRHISTARNRVYISANTDTLVARVYRLDGERWTDISAQFPADAAFHTFLDDGAVVLAGTAWSGVWKGNPDAGSAVEDGAGSAGAGAGVVAAPNPAVDGVTFSVTLDRPQHVRLSLHTLLGATAAVLADGVLGAGRTQVRWERGDAPPGVYLYRLERDGHMSVGRIAVVR